MHRRQTISVLVNDMPGVLQRVAGLFGRRGFNIESITVGASEEPGLSRMVIVTMGDQAMVEQIQKQLYKLIDVIKVVELVHETTVSRELALIQVRVDAAQRSEILATVDVFRAAIVDVAPSSIMIQVVGEPTKIDALIRLLTPYGIVQQARTGVTAMMRGMAKT
jgi:acetolactate synthase-1/3 small subunit